MLLLYKKIDGARLYYRSWGDGDDLVLLLHGAMIPSALWSAAGPALASGGDRRVIAPDFLGFGSSDKPTRREYGLDALYRDLMGVLSLFRPRGRLYLVAHDTAAVPALRLALEESTPVDGLVLVDAWLAGERERLVHLVERASSRLAWRILLHGRALRQQARSLVQDSSALTAEALTAIEAPFRTDPAARKAFHRFAADLVASRETVAALRGRIEEIEIPVAVSAGAGDVYRPQEATRALADEAEVEPQIISGAGHLPPLERPKAFVEVVEKLIARVEKEAAERESAAAAEEAEGEEAAPPEEAAGEAEG